MSSDSFPPHLYSYVPGRGFGVTPRSSHWVVPAACATYEPLADDKPDPARPWSRSPNATIVRLGPHKSSDAWINHERACSLLVMRGGDTSDAHLHGFAALDLWPLAGSQATLRVDGKGRDELGARPRHEPSVEVGALLVAKALADAWEKYPRLAVNGPAWALELVAALPGVAVYDTTSSCNRRGHVTAWGRRWEIPDDRTVTPYDVASRLSGPSASGFVSIRGAVGSLSFLLGGITAADLVRVRATVEDADHWRIATNLGKLVVHEPKTVGYSRWDEPVVRWPSSEDAWLVELVGDGEPVA